MREYEAERERKTERECVHLIVCVFDKALNLCGAADHATGTANSRDNKN